MAMSRNDTETDTGYTQTRWVSRILVDAGLPGVSHAGMVEGKSGYHYCRPLATMESYL
jgi:hypothetical protein